MPELRGNFMFGRMAAERLAYGCNKLRNGSNYYARFDEQWLIIRADKTGEHAVNLTEEELKSGQPTAKPTRRRKRG
jgi:hypothetical protein